jgi:hypothetical protein
MSTINPRIVMTVALAAVALIWGVFIWPTPYFYEKISYRHSLSSRSDARELLYRINRFTGEATLIIGAHGAVDESNAEQP